MELRVSICVAVLGVIGAAVAIKGETWNPHKVKWFRKLTHTGWAAAICLALSLIFGIIKEIQSAESQTQLEIKNAKLQSTLDQTQLTLTKTEELKDIKIEIDTFEYDPQEKRGRGFNSLPELAEKASSESANGRDVGIVMKISYRPITVWLAGVSRGREEIWQVFVAGDGGNPDAKPIRFSKKPDGFLIDLLLGESKVKGFFEKSPKLVSLFDRSYTAANHEELFRPSYELGEFQVIMFGWINPSKKSIEQILTNLPTVIHTPITLQHDYIADWQVSLTVNDKELRNLGSTKFPRVKDVLTQLRNWKLNPEYEDEITNAILLSPISEQWQNFRPVMGRNMSKLLYGNTK